MVQNHNNRNKLGHTRSALKGDTEKQYFKLQNEEIYLANLGDDIAENYEKNSMDCQPELLKIITKNYINAIIQKDKLATLRYEKSSDQVSYQSLIDELRKLQESQE
jgi:hypothetical protein